MLHWLLTSTTYGTWLPGDSRGCVTPVRDYRSTDAPTSTRVEHNHSGEPYEAAMPGLSRSAASRLKSEPVLINQMQADVVLEQFLASASYRGWRLLAIAIMKNHFHLVVRSPDEALSSDLLKEFKAYGSRALNRQFGKRRSGTWWTKGGSKRKLPNEEAILRAINYVLNKQPNPLVTWSPEDQERPPPF